MLKVSYFLQKYCDFAENFYHRWMLNFIKSFCCIYKDNHIILILNFVNVVYHIDWFANLNHLCIPGINPTWSCMILLRYCWIQFANALLKIIASVFIRNNCLYSLSFFFFFFLVLFLLALEEVASNPTIELPELTQNWGNRLLESTNKTLCTPGPRRKEQWPHKTDQHWSVRVQESPVGV